MQAIVDALEAIEAAVTADPASTLSQALVALAVAVGKVGGLSWSLEYVEGGVTASMVTTAPEE